MSFVRTLLGDIDPESMGFTLAHEHIVCRPPYWAQKNESDLLLDDPEKSKLDVADFKAAGGNTIVDATAIDYGRDVPAVAQIARDTKVTVIGTAGFNKGLLWDAAVPPRISGYIGGCRTMNEWITNSSVEKLADFVIEEVESGLEGTKYPGGQVKFGTGYNSISPLEAKTIEAVSAAHLKTGAPVHSHTEHGTMALRQIEILKSCGVDLKEVSFGHMDRNMDIWYHRKIASTGAFICFDGIGKIKYHTEYALITQILTLVKDGFADQILISGDTARKSYYKHYGSGLGLDYVFYGFIPMFTEIARSQGFDASELIDKFFRANPRRCMTFSVG